MNYLKNVTKSLIITDSFLVRKNVNRWSDSIDIHSSTTETVQYHIEYTGLDEITIVTEIDLNHFLVLCKIFNIDMNIFNS